MIAEYFKEREQFRSAVVVFYKQYKSIIVYLALAVWSQWRDEWNSCPLALVHVGLEVAYVR